MGKEDYRVFELVKMSATDESGCNCILGMILS